MAFGTMYLTSAGASLAAKTLESKNIEITKFSVGSGTLSDSSVETIKDLTNLINFIQSFEITKIEKSTDTQVTVKGLFQNSEIVTDFYLKELGLYAKDTETEEEILFAYMNYGDEAEHINTPDTLKQEIYFETLISIGNADNVIITTEKTSIYVTEKDLEERTTIQQATITLNSTVNANEDYTLPSEMYYQVGNDSLEVNYCSSKLIKGQDYIEVGNDGEVSNTIQFLDSIGDLDMSDVEGFEDFEETLEFIVRGEYDSDN